MKSEKKVTASELASKVFEVREHLGPGMKIGTPGPSNGPTYTPKFTHLKKDSIILRMLDFIRQHPGCGRKEVKAACPTAYGTSFQEITWAGLVTPRKYAITTLGENLLREYGIIK